MASIILTIYQNASIVLTVTIYFLTLAIFRQKMYIITYCNPSPNISVHIVCIVLHIP